MNAVIDYMTPLDVMHKAAGDEMRKLGGCSLRHAIKVALEALPAHGFRIVRSDDDGAD